eukprot:gene13679-biopygen511
MSSYTRSNRRSGRPHPEWHLLYRTCALTDAQVERVGFCIKMLQKCDQSSPGRVNGASRPGPGRAGPGRHSQWPAPRLSQEVASPGCWKTSFLAGPGSPKRLACRLTSIYPTNRMLAKTASGMASFYLTGALTDARVESGHTVFCAHPCVPSMGPIGSEL